MNEFNIGDIIRYKTSDDSIATATVIGVYDDEYGKWLKLEAENGFRFNIGVEPLKNAMV